MRELEADRLSTDELLQLADRQVRLWADVAGGLVPEGVGRVDAHCHVGADVDGSHLSPDQLVAQLDAAGMERAWITPLQQRGDYIAANAAVREAAAASAGRLRALHRCDPRAQDPARDAEAGLDGGAVGLKWHPRAECFTMADEVAVRTAAVAGERGVPVLIHAGRGMEGLGDGVLQLARRHPRATFVLAHAAISDLSWLVDAAADTPNLVYDTSWWRPVDLAALLSQVPPGRVLHGSDPPYGTPRLGLQITTRMARACGWGDAAMRELMGDTATRILDPGAGPAEPADAAAATAITPEVVPAFQRAAEYVACAVQIEFAGGDARETFDLGCCALELAHDHPRRPDAELLQAVTRVGEALLARDAAAADGDPDVRQMTSPVRHAGIELLICAVLHMATPALPITGIDRVGWDPRARFV